MARPERATSPGRPRRANWQSSRIRVLLSEEDVRVLAGLAQPGERPLDTLRRALRMAADQAAILRRLDAIEARLAGASAPPPAPSPAPAPAADHPVARAAAAILRWGGDDDDG